MGQHQYLEGVRRQVERCTRLGSANDGAVWINRITTTNYAHIVYSIDWAHAHGRLSTVAKAAFGDGTSQAQQWTHKQVELLWHGRVEDVVTALQVLDWDRIAAWKIFAIPRPTLKLANTTWIMRAFGEKGTPLAVEPWKAALTPLSITA